MCNIALHCIVHPFLDLQIAKINYWYSVPIFSLVKRPAPSPITISSAQKITKPAAKYGVPLTVRRPSEVVRKVPDAAKKPFKLKQVRTMGNKENVFYWQFHTHFLPIHYHSLCLNEASRNTVYHSDICWCCPAVCYIWEPPGVMCCPGSPSCSGSEESESGGGGEEKAWGTSESAYYLQTLY